jgi:anaerobic ribonucleoside-triphosphate reductase
MAVTGFNVGNSMSLMDISLAIDFLTDKSLFEPDLQNIKDKITNKDKIIDTRSQSNLTDEAPVERGQDVPFERYRRITGYIVPDINRWNNGKRHELKDRTYNKI